MTEWGLFFSNLITAGLRTILYFYLVYRLLSTEKAGRRCFLAGLAGIFVIVLCSSLLHLPVFAQMALEAAWTAFCAFQFQKADGRMCLFLSIFYEIGIAFWQFLLTAGLGILFCMNTLPESTELSGQTASWILHLLLAGMAVLAVFREHRPAPDGKGSFRLFSLPAVAGLPAVVTLSQQTRLSIPEDTLDMWMILAIVLMMAVLVFNMSRQYETEKELARLKSEQAELLEREYTALNRVYEANARLFHDFHNHIGTLQQLIAHQSYGRALDYLRELQAPVKVIADTVHTGDETIDYLINSKIAAAFSSRIRLEVQVEFPRNTNIHGADLCAILGNLLDNALEAAGKIVEPERRVVRLTIRRIHQMLVIKVENCFEDIWANETGQLRTTKTDGGLHGWGLKSAMAAAEKYDGTVRTTYEGHTFIAVATLSFHGVSEDM